MKRLLVYLLVMTLLLAGCGEKAPDSTTSQEELPPAAEESLPQEAPEESESDTDLQDSSGEAVSFGWERQSRGGWPLEQTLETLQFCGHTDPVLDDANETMRLDTENNAGYYDAAVAKGEDQCQIDGDVWSSQWIYPMSGERYLNAVTVQRTHYYFRTDQARTWNVVMSNYVYDKEEARLIELDEALAMAGMSQGELEKEIWEYAENQNIGIYEKLSSIGFYMAPEGHPVFIIGGTVRGPEDPYGWPTFFNWENGEIRWPGEEPVPLYLVDTDWNDELSCLQGMGQYDGAAIISVQEAFDTLCEIYEVQDYLSQGMTLMDDGTTAWIDGEEHVCIALGTDHEDHFVTEFLYAVSWLSVYCMDPLSGDWIPVGFG